ncbi:MAG: YfhO family protein [Planctomycetaceae bacterium]
MKQTPYVKAAKVVAGVLLPAIALSLIFWWELWTGGALIGGDLYSYYFPQKTFLSERLHAGELPLWNPLVGHGYPTVAESQTGICYPVNLLFFGLMPVNAAYNAVQLLHYVLAFVFACAYCRRIRIGWTGSLFAALIYTYGWFPSRICLEWAIIGGAWLPLAFWAVESYLDRREWKYLFAMIVAFVCQILPGHYCLGFITQLAVLAYVFCRCRQLRERVKRSTDDAQATTASRSLAHVFIGLAVVFASTYAISAVQVLPTWELKRISQRSDAEGVHDPGYGHLPAWYWMQTIAPWKWYLDPTFDMNSLLAPGSPPTNKVEAHLYFGMIPILVVIFGVVTRNVFRQHCLAWIWLLLGLLALSYTPGWFLPITRHLPGFSFFIGPGRFGIITTFAVAVLTGVMVDWFRSRFSGRLAYFLIISGAFITAYDLYTVSRLVTYATIIPTSPLVYIGESPVRAVLKDKLHETRVFTPGVNLPTILGITCAPVYLGIGPAEYYDPKLTFPEPFDPAQPPRAEQIDWFDRAGVTHILSMQPITGSDWPCRLIWQGGDPFLNRAWGTSEPLFLYELFDSRGRLAWSDSENASSVKFVTHEANRVVIRANAAQTDKLILTELDYPGWQVTIDGAPAEKTVIDGMFRGVTVPAGEHDIVWTFRSHSFRWGLLITILSLTAWAAAGHRRYHGTWLRKKMRDEG